MKKIILAAIMLLSISVATKAQSTSTPVAVDKVKKETKQQNPAAYACPKCYHITKGEGQCTDCKMAKVQLGTYYCPKCNMAGGSKPGNCSMCKSPNVQMTRKYCAAHGGTPVKEMQHKKAA